MVGSEVAELQRLLTRFGYLDVATEPGVFDDATDKAVRKYQTFMGLENDGLVGSVTKRMIRTRRCGASDRCRADLQLAATPDCRWNLAVATYQIYRLPPGVDPDRSRVLIAEAFAAWESVCGLAFREVAQSERAHISINWESPRYEPALDELGVYAYGHKPCHSNRPGTILMDRDETWLDDDYSQGADGYFIRLNIMHEIGHAIGLDHTRSERDIMHPNPQRAGLRGFSEADIVAINQLYPAVSTAA